MMDYFVIIPLIVIARLLLRRSLSCRDERSMSDCGHYCLGVVLLVIVSAWLIIGLLFWAFNGWS